MRLTETKIAAIMRQKGYKLTRQRHAILHAIANCHDHMTPADIFMKARRDNSDIGLVTVYRTLDMLTGLGLICEVHSGGNCRSYVLKNSFEHHHHLLCSECGAVTDFTDCDLSELEKRLSEETGFKIEGHLLEFAGQCSNCRQIDST